jgi:hypothetical protein
VATLSSASPRSLQLAPWRALGLPLFFTACLLAFLLVPQVTPNRRLSWSFLGAGTALLAWNAALLIAALRQRRTFTLEIVLRPQHYVQACAHTSIFLYWGWHWRPVYASAFLIVAQLLFAYAFDILLNWSRRDRYTLGFGPFPIILSTNLFLWFKPDWFYLQFLMIAVGFAAKELLRWERDGRQVHIFNPSAFTLTVFSLALILTGRSDATYGQEIAVTQFYPPQMYLFLFLVALPGQLLFGVTTMTMSAVLSTYLFGLAYYAATGTYFFFDSYIPIAVFLGMHLLFTDPSTAPRTELGRMIFGVMYGLSTVALYALLGAAGLPTFYDKLLQVPALNLLVKRIDHAVRSTSLGRLDPGRLGASLSQRRRNLTYIAVWTVVFASLSAVQGVGDRHPGQWLPFWRQACDEQRISACQYLSQLYATYCRAGSGWACNELGILQVDKELDAAAAAGSLARGCELGFQPACANAARVRDRGPRVSEHPPAEELPVLLRGSKGPIADRSLASLYERACDQGWRERCRKMP